MCVPEGYEEGPLSQAFVDDFQACWSVSSLTWDAECKATASGFAALTGCDLECISENARFRSELCQEVTSGECEETETRACASLKNSDDDFSALSTCLTYVHMQRWRSDLKSDRLAVHVSNVCKMTGRVQSASVTRHVPP